MAPRPGRTEANSPVTCGTLPCTSCGSPCSEGARVHAPMECLQAALDVQGGCLVAGSFRRRRCGRGTAGAARMGDPVPVGVDGGRPRRKAAHLAALGSVRVRRGGHSGRRRVLSKGEQCWCGRVAGSSGCLAMAACWRRPVAVGDEHNQLVRGPMRQTRGGSGAAPKMG